MTSVHSTATHSRSHRFGFAYSFVRYISFVEVFNQWCR